MDITSLHIILGLAVVLPLVSFFTLLVAGRRLTPAWSGYIATGAIVAALGCSLWSAGIWLSETPHAGHSKSATAQSADAMRMLPVSRQLTVVPASGSPAANSADAGHSAARSPTYVAGDYYVLGRFGNLRLTIGYYIDSLTIVMFCVVCLISSCIHFYSMGYMHEEEHEVTDREVTLSDGSVLERPGRYAVFFQYLSLFCFSMLGLVLAGNLAMVFAFWELVGICSYFLIGFYIERKSACNAANKAFIVNRVGDFGMIVGLMALWSGLGTMAFGDYDAEGVHQRGIFSQVRPAERDHQLTTPEGLIRYASQDDLARWVAEHPQADLEQMKAESDRLVSEARAGGLQDANGHSAYWMLIVAGVGIFCGCVGKSAQFPLHVWLPDAMEGPTPVSALVHSATMVAAGVYLVGRFYPVFAPEVLLVIAVIGVITLFMAATIAITATDIKRVLAYSTVSQLGYMMLALGLGGWLAGMLHLVTHAFFKSLLFMCSGSVIHAVHTNEMTEMGGLRKKMPYTAYTMLIGCLAISGISIPFVIGFSGYYSKDMILEQAYSFLGLNPTLAGGLFFGVAMGAAAITAFYMFRLWFMTFTGQPRDANRYDHAHESPKVMYVPLIILAVFATCIAWQLPFSSLSLQSLLEQSRPLGTAAAVPGNLVEFTWPDEHFAHEDAQFWSIVFPVTMLATGTALGGILLAAAMYGFGALDPREVSRQFARVYRFLRNKWWFDELYEWLFVQRVHQLARLVAAIDRRWIDGLIDGLASITVRIARVWEYVADQLVVDRFVNVIGRRTYLVGLALRRIQTGSLRQYVLFLVLGAIVVFVMVVMFWLPASGP